MDPTQLSNLLTESTNQLTNLHQQLGSSPSDVSSSIEALGKALRKAVDNQVDKCQKRVDEIRSECQSNLDKIQQLQEALREENETDENDGERGIDENMPLLQKQALLKSKCLHLETQHSQRLTESNSLISELQSYIPILGSKVQIPTARQSNKGKEKASNSTLTQLPSSYLEALRTQAQILSTEVEERTRLLGSLLRDIVSLWTELQDPPIGITPRNLHSTDGFQESILNSLGLKPIFSTISSSPPPNGNGDEDEDHHVEYTFEGFVDVNPDGPSSLEDLTPNDELLEKANSLKESLESIKTDREIRIQQLYDQLEELWSMCEVEAADIAEFVLENKGSTQSAVEAYEAELLGMQAHKAKFIEVFINRCRETIQELWASLHISEDEQSSLFHQIFIEISEISNEDKEALQTLHEEYIQTLKVEFELKEKLFKKMSQWKIVKEEEEQLKISEKDPNRYKNAKAGDMLKEEKARKRIKVLKPKLEETLRKEVGNWEKETGREFRYDGVRLLDILGVEEKPVPAGSKRMRTTSTSTTTDTSSVLSASTNSRTSSRIAPTPLRNGRGGVPATPSEGSVAKKQRTASGSVVPSSSIRRTNGVGLTAPPVSGMGAKSRFGSHQQPLQTPSFQTPTPRNYTHTSNQSSPSRLPQPKRFASNASNVSSNSGSVKFGISNSNGLSHVAKKSFRPRPSQINGGGSSSNPPSSDSDSQSTKSKVKARLSMNKFKEALIGPGGRDDNDNDGKWSEIGNHRWPTTTTQNQEQEQMNVNLPRSTSSGSSNHSDATTLIHNLDSNTDKFRKSRRGPSMSLEASLAMMANSKSGMPTIRHVSSESLNKTSGNWAVLDDESGIMDGVMDFNDDDDDDVEMETETRNGFGNDRIEEENESLMF